MGGEPRGAKALRTLIECADAATPSLRSAGSSSVSVSAPSPLTSMDEKALRTATSGRTAADERTVTVAEPIGPPSIGSRRSTSSRT